MKHFHSNRSCCIQITQTVYKVRQASCGALWWPLEGSTVYIVYGKVKVEVSGFGQIAHVAASEISQGRIQDRLEAL